MMSRCSNKILVILMFVFFPGLVSAQPQVQETRLLKVQRAGKNLVSLGFLGSKLFAYGRFDEGIGYNLFRLEAEKEMVVLNERRGVGIGEYITAVETSRDDSLIVFESRGGTLHWPNAIHSVRPDGSQLTKLVQSGDDCDEFVWPGYGSHICSFPSNPRLSPDGRKIIFFNEVREETEKGGRTHYYLSMIPSRGGPIVRLVDAGPGFRAVWSEDGRSIYYYYSRRSGYDPSNGVPRRYDLETGRSEFLTDTTWGARSSGLAVSRADGALYFLSKQGFVRLDPETGVAEVVSEQYFDAFDLSPDGRRAAGLKEGDVTIVDLEFPSSAPLEVERGTVDELKLGRIPVARKKWVLQRGYASRQLYSEARKRTGVKGIRWLDNERLWCVVQEDRSTDPTRASKPEVRVGIVRLAN